MTKSDITRDTRISVLLVIALIAGVWKVAKITTEAEGTINECKSQIEELEDRLDTVERRGTP